MSTQDVGVEQGRVESLLVLRLSGEVVVEKREEWRVEELELTAD